ncbi:MAG: precorrin-6y C5,15-methyltransferase (decarboxylating) subunit CbiE [Corynebacterium sp.]|uniref:precorrin-6y C5,15-methyltransferase (decarboxylating) subunit CbiE n=1 Tax=Corynebacterium sp. TaxID=1720 RepID=UPI0026DC94C7|nr:precorrin-6y C5,15-methyltransferase (decarboxylating) subunit CbiE [Corynebacterium sp.]MDO5098219.1 precorrin-6y C5,15-methyltransferase (decarboxylating) subunit CbiE [Corynebacterium sp.]
MTEAKARLPQSIPSDAGDARALETTVSVIGLPAIGMSELGAAATKALYEADVVLGSWRQLNLLADDISGDRRPWPSPMIPALPGIFAELRGKRVAVLASGDPMFHGIGSTLRRKFPDMRITVYSHVSSASLACARLGWAVDRTPVYSLVTQVVESLVLPIESGRPFLILGRDEKTPGEVCQLLVDMHQGDAQVEVLSDLGSADEAHSVGCAFHPPSVVSALNVIAVVPSKSGNPRTPGLPDSKFENDGQLTKSHIRALTVSALAPSEGDVLWDIGGGAGSVAIECLRATNTTRAVCFEIDEIRRGRILKNARTLGVAHRLAVQGEAPTNYTSVPDNPDVVFIGGGITTPGVFSGAWDRLKPGGRLVANAVTIESEQMLWKLKGRHGGTLARFDIAKEHSVGGFSTFKPALPVTQWVVTKTDSDYLEEFNE